MIKNISTYISRKIYEATNLNKHQQDKVKYLLEVILTDLSKFLLLVAFFSIIGIRREFLVMLLYSIPLRINIGGFHLKRYFTCLLFSIVYYVLIFSLANLLFLKTPVLLATGIICIVVIFIISPVIPMERMGTTSMKIYQLKIRATALSITYLLFSVIINNPYTRYGVWVIIIQTILLIIAKRGITHEKKIIKQTTATTM